MDVETHIEGNWLLPLRLITYSLVFGVTVFGLGFPSSMQLPFLLYSLVTLAALTALVLRPKAKAGLLFQLLVALHFVFEIVSEAGIMYATNGIYGPFAALFLMTIVSASLVYRLAGTLLVASLVSIAHATVSWLNVSSDLSQRLADPFSPGDEKVFYTIFLHILIYYLVAFIAGYLADRLQSKDRELHSASAALRRARLETGDILRHLNSGLLTIDGTGIISYFNQAAETILGYQENEVAGKDCRAVFSDRVPALADLLIWVLESRQQMARTELAVTLPGGIVVPIGVSTSILYDEERDARGVIAIFQDLTEAKELQGKIRQADRMAAIGELSASIAHEIRNPLASISGSVQVLGTELALQGDHQRLLELIIKESNRLNRILSDFLIYARVDRPQFTKVELNHVLSEAIELVRAHPSYNPQIAISVIDPETVTYVSGDEDLIKQLLLNVLVNACEAFGDAPGRITVSISQGGEDQREVSVRIRDNGPGIRPKNLRKIFLPFFSTKKSGSGLGLSIVSRLMEAMGGRIEAQSNPEAGTTFLLYFRTVSGENRNSREQTGKTSISPPISSI